ncbi:MAG: class I SAM-dependent methyltransferase [Lachnospiraceae bacterium]|nr:class I SAM-dependent methyltransferase [Lachnospiraceae bacterium]
MSNTRIKKEITNIDYAKTLDFFNKRADKYQEGNPYSVTMYQDNDPALVEERNKAEVMKLLPLLQLDRQSRVLDLACGIGRWSDAINADIDDYCGIDFSENLIELAKRRHHKENRSFYVGAANEVWDVLKKHHKGGYNRILLIGILMYINDEDLITVMNQISKISEEHAVICIREPMGIDERLTLKGFYSEELKDNYNAIYRTKDELMSVFEKTLIPAGFQTMQSGFLFEEDALNNRKETAQYYFILKRQPANRADDKVGDG